jgi:hypothetical protein
MTTYVYETIPSKSGERPRYYEIKQSMNAAALKKHPETGETIRRGAGRLRHVEFQASQQFRFGVRLRPRRLLWLN